MFDRTVTGRQLKLLNVIDEYTRECLAIRVDHRLGSREVLEVLDAIVRDRGLPEHIEATTDPNSAAAGSRSG